MTIEMELLDALGLEVQLGGRYGYSSTTSGRARVVIGTAHRLTVGGKVTLKVEEVKHFLYGKPYVAKYDRSAELLEGAELISVRPYTLFPVVLPEPEVVGGA